MPRSTSANATKNSITVASAVRGNLIGASVNAGSASENILSINADVIGNITGGQSATGSASHNELTFGKVKVTGDVTGGTGATTEGNIIRLRNTEITGTLTGGTGTAAADKGNTLVVRPGLNANGEVATTEADYTSKIGSLTGIKNLHFYLEDGVKDSPDSDPNPMPLLRLTRSQGNIDLRGMNIGVGVEDGVFARSLSVNDTISLLKTAGNDTLTLDSPVENKVMTMQNVSDLYEFELKKRGTGELVAGVTKAAISEQTKSFVETRAASVDFINRGADLLAGAGISAAGKEARGQEGKEKYKLWAATSKSDMSAETGSYVDTNGWHLNLGWATQHTDKKGTNRLLSPFVEYVKGKYDSYLDDGTHGSGKVSYIGAGVMGRVAQKNGLWAEAALHAGRAKSDYTGSIYKNTVTKYDTKNIYYAAQLGIGKDIETKRGEQVSAYLRYFFSHTSGVDADLMTKGKAESYTFDSVNSNRVRIGTRYSRRDSKQSEVYAALAWEYELSGKAAASYRGYATPSPSLRGGSLMMELGYRFAPKGSRLSYDLHLTGWQRKREGFTGGAQMNWAF